LDWPHETAPRRVLPFYPAFLAGMCIVVLADDAFTFLVSWEFMSVVVMGAGHGASTRARQRACRIRLSLSWASFGTLALLLMFGLFAAPTEVMPSPTCARPKLSAGAAAPFSSLR